MNEKRHFKRIEFDSTAHIFSDNRSWETPLIDICLKGLLTKKPAEFNAVVGDHFIVEVQLTSSDCVIKMNAKIAHIEDISVGFECENIDIDSVTHLRRLVELNLGDTMLLDRELSELVAYDN